MSKQGVTYLLSNVGGKLGAASVGRILVSDILNF